MQPRGRNVTSKSPTLLHSPTIYVDSLNSGAQNNMMEESSLAFLSGNVMLGNMKHSNNIESSEHRLTMNGGGVHVKQENTLSSDSMNNPLPAVDIKREAPDHSVLDYEEMNEEHSEHVYGLAGLSSSHDVTAEDLSIVNEHMQDAQMDI